MSQRQDGYNGGIQVGKSASSVSSKDLEKTVRDYLIENKPERWIPGYTGEQIKDMLGSTFSNRISGCYPDGGIITDEMGFPLISFECKYQGEKGNAIERWFKNYAILSALGVKRYITFCAGDGFFDNNSAERIIACASLISDPQAPLWENEESVLGFYRWREANLVKKEIPSILRREVLRYGV